MKLNKVITKQWLDKYDACQNAKEWVLSLKNKSIENIFKIGMKEKKYQWINWGICRLFNKRQKIKYAIYAAKQVIDIYEKKYLNDDRPRKAIKAAEKYLNRQSIKNAAIAAVASVAVADAAAASAAVAAAVAASAFASDARKELQIKILNFGWELLKGSKK